MATMIIEGERAQAASGETYEVLNPSTGEVVDRVPSGGPEDVDRAARAAAKAYQTWGRLAPAERARILHRAAEHAHSKVSEIGPILTAEQGKTLLESKIEAERFADNIAWFADLADKIHGEHVSLASTKLVGMVVRRPIGVTGAIIPWNFPLTLAANKVAPSIAAGNCVVLKPASTTPLATLACIQALIDGGLPEGVINVVLGSGTNEAIVEHPLIRKIALTGSTPTGKHVMRKAADRLKKLTLELGGSDPCIVMDDADIDAAAVGVRVGRYFNCGQACLATKRIYVHEAVYDEFVEKIVAQAKKMKPGDGSKPDSRMGPMHSATQRAEVEAQLQDALDRGARIVYGGGRPEGDEYARGNFINPSVVLDVAPGSRMLTEEVFGPALPIVKIKDLDEAIRLANDSPFGLGSSIWTRDMGKAFRAINEIEAGYTWINSVQIAYDELPFGGTKESGFGKEHGIEAFHQYTEQKSVVIGGL